MILFHRLKSLCRWIFRRGDVEAEMQRELDSFVEMSAADPLREGDAGDARRMARIQIGGIEQTKERIRSDRWGAQLDHFLRDVHYGWRSLMRQPGFTATVILTLAIGIGLNTAIYTAVRATMLRPLPFKQPERLMKITLIRPERGGGQVDLPIWSYPKYETFRQNQQVFEETAIYRAIALNLSGHDPERFRVEEVSASYFPTLGIRAQIGRTFFPDEDVTPEKDFVAVISDGLWQRRFGGDTGIVGKTITLDMKRYTVVGVLPAGFQGLSGPADIWAPVHRNSAEDLDQPFAHAWECVVRLKDGVSVEQAKRAVGVLGRVVDEAHQSPVGGNGWGARADALNEIRIDSGIRRSVLVSFGAVTFVFLIACANIANLLLARGTARRREIAIRTAIGAGRFRVMRQLLTESILLSTLGGAASLLVAYVAVYALNLINPAGSALGFGAGPSLLPAGRRLSGLTLLALNSISIDSAALLFTLGASLFAAILFGIGPSWRAVRVEPIGALKKEQDQPSRTGLWGKDVLIVMEIAVAFVLLIGAGLLIKSFARLSDVPVGIDANDVLTARVSVPVASPVARNFLTELEDRLMSQPGVASAALGACHALAGGCTSAIIFFRDRPEVPRGTEPLIGVVRVSSNYFASMKIPLIRGRLFTRADRADAPKTVIINETAARRYFPGEDPIGKPIGIGINGFAQRVEIIGIVGDVRYGQLDQAPEPDAYVSLLQAPAPNLYLFVRGSGDPAALVPLVKQHVAALNRDLPIYDVKTMMDRVRDSAARARFNAIVLGIFAAMAVALAAIGIYGVMSFVVRQRTREIGIRLALGARPQTVARQTVRRAAWLVVAGTTVGLTASLAATRILTASLYAVEPSDPQTYVLVPLILVIVALTACYLPARRASNVDPAITLRAE